MSSSARKSVKIRRRGRHAAPSQVEQFAGKAAVAAPAAVVVGGVIMGGAGTANAATTPHASVSASGASGAHAPGAHASAGARSGGAQASAKTGKTQAVHATLDAATSSDQSYSVKSGDTLASIARQFYGSAGNWQWIADDNSSLVSDPNMIFPGQYLRIPSSAPSSSSSSSSSASSSSASSTGSSSTGSSSSGSDSASTVSDTSSSSSDSGSGSGYSGSESGTLGCSGLENLWEQAGGSPSEAHTAAEVAMAESGGNQYAHSPTDDYGYWQINGSHGSEATYDPMGNAKAAISLSSDGTDWSQWSTYSSGAYAGKC